ncbi:DUF4913 domain-containing protein [Corynebacterium durum]|uniref:DUF4913 domain-containing protein n=1 Tax=Corynebacterium durum TaxID=61592 RepID=UPI0028898592|nr:DUF4913 domain-containing protein [Corynebacterium durum]
MEDSDIEFQFATVYEFVDTVIRPLYAVSGNRIREVAWSKMWWSHSEAMFRLHFLWQRYEAQRIAEPATFGETWLRMHGDYHMRYLMQEGGVFFDCKHREQNSVPLPTTPMEVE